MNPRKLYKHKVRNGLYSIAYIEDPDHYHATGQDNLDAAIAWAKRKKGEFLGPKPILFKDAARGFFDARSPWAVRQIRRGRTFSAEYLPQMRGRLKNYLLPRWGDTPVRDITMREFDDWLLDLQGIKNSTKNKIVDAAFILFREWKATGLIDFFPLDGLTHLTPSDMVPREIFTAEELRKIFPVDRAESEAVWADMTKAHREHGQLWLSFFVALKDTGARPAELLALTWGDWMPEHCGFPIFKAVENTTGHIKMSTKTGSRKPVYLSARGVQELMLWGAISEHTEPRDLIWSFDGLAPVKTDSAAKHFRAVCERAEVNRGRRTPYCLRHTFATAALETMPLGMVQTLLGHSAKSMTVFKSYFHPTPAIIMRMGEGAREALRSVWGEEKKTHDRYAEDVAEYVQVEKGMVLKPPS